LEHVYCNYPAHCGYPADRRQANRPAGASRAGARKGCLPWPDLPPRFRLIPGFLTGPADIREYYRITRIARIPNNSRSSAQSAAAFRFNEPFPRATVISVKSISPSLGKRGKDLPVVALTTTIVLNNIPIRKKTLLKKDAPPRIKFAKHQKKPHVST
jgi:hypothetical protein